MSQETTPEGLCLKCSATQYCAEYAPTYLECPCCGDVGAEPHEDGFYYDGDPLVCGCNGFVHADEDETWINIGDDPCEPGAKCHG